MGYARARTQWHFEGLYQARQVRAHLHPRYYVFSVCSSCLVLRVSCTNLEGLCCMDYRDQVDIPNLQSSRRLRLSLSGGSLLSLCMAYCDFWKVSWLKARGPLCNTWVAERRASIELRVAAVFSFVGVYGFLCGSDTFMSRWAYLMYIVVCTREKVVLQEWMRTEWIASSGRWSSLLSTLPCSTLTGVQR